MKCEPLSVTALGDSRTLTNKIKLFRPFSGTGIQKQKTG